MTKMNDKSTILAGDSINEYGGYASNALANIQQMQQAAANIQSETQALYLSTEQNRKRKVSLNQILGSLTKQQIMKEPNNFLNDLLHTKNRQLPDAILPKESEQEINMPVINLPDMNWAYKYLQQIEKENFNKVKDVCIQQRQNVSALTNNLKRYSSRLIEVEEKLKKCYEQARSKRRYI